jgi:hypothetical protein
VSVDIWEQSYKRSLFYTVEVRDGAVTCFKSFDSRDEALAAVPELVRRVNALNAARR